MSPRRINEVGIAKRAIPDAELTRLIEVAVAEAHASIPEDDRPHPRVGAVLATRDGKQLLRAHRGEVAGAHAEFTLLNKAADAGIDPTQCVLLSTLEPCTHRGEGKIPCAERVAAAGIPHIQIGCLDPNPSITGRGEMYLSLLGRRVERFPFRFIRELNSINRDFIEQFRSKHVAPYSLYAGRLPAYGPVLQRPFLVEDRNGRLLQTLDLVSGSQRDVLIASGSSWFREAFPTLLEVSLGGRRIRVLRAESAATGTRSQDVDGYAALLAIGAQVGTVQGGLGLRCTFIDPGNPLGAAVFIDHENANLYRRPMDERMLDLLEATLDRMWRQSAVLEGRRPEIVRLTEAELVGALRSHVPQYRDASVSIEDVDPGVTLPLTTQLEHFKFARAIRLEQLVAIHGLPPALRVRGAPWPITPPVVEVGRDGRAVVVDGTHRFYVAVDRGLESVAALVVRGVTATLPARVQDSWDGARLFSAKVPRATRYSDYQPEMFRPIREAFETIGRARST